MIKEHTKLVTLSTLATDLENYLSSIHSQLYEMGINEYSLYYIDSLMTALQEGVKFIVTKELKDKEERKEES